MKTINYIFTTIVFFGLSGSEMNNIFIYGDHQFKILGDQNIIIYEDEDTIISKNQTKNIPELEPFPEELAIPEDIINKFTFNHPELPITFYFIEINHDKLDNVSKKLLPHFCLTWNMGESDKNFKSYCYKENMNHFAGFLKNTMQCDKNTKFTFLFQIVIQQFHIKPSDQKDVNNDQLCTIIEIMQYLYHMATEYNLVINENESLYWLQYYKGELKKFILEKMLFKKKWVATRNKLNKIEKILIDATK